MDYIDRFRVEPGRRVKLRKLDPGFHGKFAGPQEVADELIQDAQKLRRLQYLLYAENRRSLLIVLQALDGAGKDGTINHVLGAMNPQDTYVHAFKQPSAEEAAHDFLWRAHRVTPGRGQIAIFNRSHYEDVLVARVHDLVPKKIWSKRYDLIRDFERGLVENGTCILKFYLHISYEEQLKRFKERLDDPTKQWKISETDYTERMYWDDYVTAYEAALEETSTKHAPWFIIPANHKWYRNLAVARIVVATMRSFDMKLPKPTVDLADIRRKYHSALALEARRNKGG
jgi:PPK2 family polyphosphate:nucleotide phosphotransferase